MEGYIWLLQALQLPPVRPKTCLYITGGPQHSLSRSWLAFDQASWQRTGHLPQVSGGDGGRQGKSTAGGDCGVSSQACWVTSGK